MAGSSKKSRLTRQRLSVGGIILLILLIALYLWLDSREEAQNQAAVPDGTQLAVHFIDVGQADCILIDSGGEYMLVDAGNNDDAKLLLSYLRDDLGIERFKCVIGTHPHEDHIGSLDVIINNFQIDTLIMPPIVADSKTFTDVVDAAEKHHLEITLPEVGDEYKIGSATFRIIAPAGDYKSDKNNWSVGIRLVYGSTAFVMCGDAEKNAEADILASTSKLSAQVLKLGHHGSSTSNSDAFLDAVSPTYAVISCGKDNDYGHPHEETIKSLKDRGITYFRTDTQGTIIAYSDGQNISWNVASAR